jgi:sugar phosphate isomerase/epimerase
VLASAGDPKTVDGWKQVADTLNKGNDKFQKGNLHAGYHNHDVEWHPIDGQKPMEILAKGTDKSVMLQLDVGTCLEAGSDPVDWIEKNPGRIRSLHLKDWSKEGGYKVLFGEGAAPWKKIFAAAESVGGVEYYLIEQEGSQYTEFETADRCLVAFHNIHS